MKTIHGLFSRLALPAIALGALLGGANSASAFIDMRTPASTIASTPSACENIPKPSIVCASCSCQVKELVSADRAKATGHCDCAHITDVQGQFGAENQQSQSYCRVLDSGAVSPGTAPGGGCSSCSGGCSVPANTQMPHFEFPRIWRSTWTHDGSFGTGMYSGYDYYLTSSGSLIEIRDPNTGYIERFMSTGGTPAWAPCPGVTYRSTVGTATSTNVTIVQPGGTTLAFDLTAYVTGGGTRGRLTSITDRNNNKIQFTYLNNPPTLYNDNRAMILSSGTDAYGLVTSFSYTTSSYFTDLNLLSKVAFSDSRSVNYFYTADNTSFVHEIDYLDSSNSTLGTSTWNITGGTVTLNEVLLPADHYGWRVTMQTPGFFGRVGGILRPDNSYVYARSVTASGGTATITTWKEGMVEQFVRSYKQQMISSSKQLMDGTWETPVTYAATGDYLPPSSYVEPASPGVPARTTIVVRDPNTDMVLQRTYPDGSVESYTYNNFNEPLTYTDRLGNKQAWNYDGSGNLLSHTVAVGTTAQASESWTYNTQGQALSYSDFNNNATGYAYVSGGTAAGELQSIVLPGTSSGPQPSGTMSLAYNLFGRVVGCTDASSFSRTVSFGYDALGRLTSTAYFGSSGTETVNYVTSAGSAALVLSTSDRNGNATVPTYDADGRIIQTDVHQGPTTGGTLTSTSGTYSTATGLLTNTNTDGRETDWTFDYLNRILTTNVHPNGSTTLTSSNTFDRYHLLQTVDYYGRATTAVYDSLDRPLSVTVQLTPCGPTITTQTQYNAQGLVSATIDGNGNRTNYRYDARNRLIATTVAAGTPLEATTRVRYDANSNVLVRIDERGKKWVNTYSVRNQLLTSADPLGDTTSYKFTSDGLVASMTNANGNTTNYMYLMCCPRVVAVTDALSFSRSSSYDNVGNVTGGTDESGRVVLSSFDGLNRQLTMTVDPMTLDLVSSTAYSTPNLMAIGTSTTATSAGASQVIVTNFDGLGRTISTSGNIAPAATTYDVVYSSPPYAGLLLTTGIVGSGSTMLSTSSFSDGAGRTVATIDANDQATVTTFDNNGNVLSTTDPDGRSVVNTYDARNRLASTTTYPGGVPATTTFTYDRANNLLTVTDPDSKVTRYSYDDANRRLTTTYGYGTGDARTWAMTYKPLGQVATLAKPNGINITYSYEPRELLASRAYAQGSGTLGTDVFTYSRIIHQRSASRRRMQRRGS